MTNGRGSLVWLVGASSGIGAALAGQLLTAGYRVAVSSRRIERLRELGGEVSGTRGNFGAFRWM